MRISLVYKLVLTALCSLGGRGAESSVGHSFMSEAVEKWGAVGDVSWHELSWHVLTQRLWCTNVIQSGYSISEKLSFPEVSAIDISKGNRIL